MCNRNFIHSKEWYENKNKAQGGYQGLFEFGSI